VRHDNKSGKCQQERRVDKQEGIRHRLIVDAVCWRASGTSSTTYNRHGVLTSIRYVRTGLYQKTSKDPLGVLWPLTSKWLQGRSRKPDTWVEQSMQDQTWPVGVDCWCCGCEKAAPIPVWGQGRAQCLLSVRQSSSDYMTIKWQCSQWEFLADGWADPPRTAESSRDFYHNWTNSSSSLKVVYRSRVSTKFSEIPPVKGKKTILLPFQQQDNHQRDTILVPNFFLAKCQASRTIPWVDILRTVSWASPLWPDSLDQR
jgi:hypothetical protein